MNFLMRGLFGVEQAGKIFALLPGLILSVGIMLMALPLADWIGGSILSLQGIDPAGKTSPVSGVLVAILMGIIVRNTCRLPESFKVGIQFTVTKILRFGIILVGIKLSVYDVVKLGAWGIPVVVAAIATGLILINWLNRLLNLPERLGTLIAAGTGICGVTSIVSTAPAIKAEEKEVAYAVANVTLFGLLGMFFYPYLAPHLLSTSEQIGLFLGTAVHETSQVVGSALTYREVFHDEVVLKVATVTKLTRNLFLAIVVPVLSFHYVRRQSGAGANRSPGFVRLFPVFVLGFVGMAVLRSLGDAAVQSRAIFGFLGGASWKALTTQIGEVWGSRYLLGTAMAGVGLGTTFSVFKGVGFKPFGVGFAGAFLVGLVGLLMALLLGQFVRL